MKKVLAAIILLCATAVAQAPTKYIMLGTYQGISYEAELDPKETAKTRNVILSGEAKDYSLITTWSYDCPSHTIKQLHASTYNSDHVLIKDEDLHEDWVEAAKGSFGRQALDKYWCKDIY